MEKNDTQQQAAKNSKEILALSREVNEQLEQMPIHQHDAVLKMLGVLGQQRLASMQYEQQAAQRKAELEKHFAGAGIHLQ